MTVTTESSIMCVTNKYQPYTNPKPNPNPNCTAKRHVLVNIQLNIVMCASYPEKFVRGSVIAPFLLLSVVIVTLPQDGDVSSDVALCSLHCSLCIWKNVRSLQETSQT